MGSKSANTWIPAAIIIFGFAVVFGLTRFVERQRPPLPAGYEDADLALQGARLKGFAFGAEGLLADWYWMNSLQYIGGKISSVGVNNLNLDDMTALNPRLLYPYLNTATDLDPHFMAPYSYGATILPAIDPAQAIALTEKGIANNPDQWRLHQYLGYVHWRLKDYENAAEVYQRGSLVPNAPIFFEMMAAKMKTEGGSRDVARDIYRQVLNESQDEASRESAALRLLQLDSLDDRDVINPALRTFRERNGRCAANWQEILPLLSNAKLPNGRELRIDQANNIVDPSGIPYRLVRSICEAHIDWPESKIPPV
jgi:tetratricopeptide (TPR) repeat protein